MAFLAAIIAFILTSVFLSIRLAHALAVMLGLTFTPPPLFGAVLAVPAAVPPVVFILVIPFIHFVVVAIAYLVAWASTPPTPTGGPVTPIQPWEALARGALVGVNASFNYMLLFLVRPILVLPLALVPELAFLVSLAASRADHARQQRSRRSRGSGDAYADCGRRSSPTGCLGLLRSRFLSARLRESECRPTPRLPLALSQSPRRLERYDP